MIGPAMMKRLTYILPLLCILSQLVTIKFMYSKLGRLQTELRSARKESLQLDSQVSETNRRIQDRQRLGRRANTS